MPNPYQLPDLIDILTKTANIRQTYIEERKQSINPERLLLISSVEIIHQFIKNDEYYDKKELAYAAAGIIFVNLKKIKESSWFSPEIKKGWLWSFTGSITYDQFLKALNITEDNKPNEDFIFICIQKLYKYLKYNIECLDTKSEKVTININEQEKIYTDIKEVLKNIIKTNLATEIKRLMTDLPKEVALKNKIDELSADYHSTDNKYRVFSLQLATAIADLSDLTNKDIRPREEKYPILNPAYLLKLGILIFQAREIKFDEYWGYESLANRSRYFRSLKKTLNVDELSQIAPEIQLACLEVLHSFLADINFYNKLQSYLLPENPLVFNENILLDIKKIELMKIKIEHHIAKCREEIKERKLYYPGFYLLGILFGFTTGSALYGVGSGLLTPFLNKSNLAAQTKVKTAKIINDVGQWLTNDTIANYFGYMISDCIAEDAFKRGTGKLMEVAGNAVGFGLGSCLGYVLIDLIIVLLQKIIDHCQLFQENKVIPQQESYYNDLIIALSELTEDILPAQKKNRILYGAGLGLFSRQPSRTLLTSNKEEENFIKTPSSEDEMSLANF